MWRQNRSRYPHIEPYSSPKGGGCYGSWNKGGLKKESAWSHPSAVVRRLRLASGSVDEVWSEEKQQVQLLFCWQILNPGVRKWRPH